MTAGEFADARKAVTVVRRVPVGRNAYGNAVHAETRLVIHDCLVAWGGSQENRDQADQTVQTATVYDMGREWPADSADRVEIDGESWEIDGVPERWPGPIGGVVVQLRKVRG